MVSDGLTINHGNLNIISTTSNAEKRILEAPPVDVQKPNAPENANEEVAAKEINKEDLKKLADELNADFKLFNASISFSIDDETQKTVIKILNRDTEEVIREFPPEELLKLASRLTEVIGRLVDETV